MKKHNLVAATLLLALTGCNDPQPAAGVADAERPVAPVAEGPERGSNTSPDSTQADRLLPPGVTLSTPVHQRSMHGYTTQAGQDRRVVIYEFMEGDIAAMADVLQRDMGAAGFSARTEADRGDGKTRITFISPEHGRVNATLVPDLGDKPANPEARGVFSLDIPLEPAAVSEESAG